MNHVHWTWDVLTFLCFLHAEDVAPRGGRLLPPLTLARLNRQLLVADKISVPENTRRGGKRGPSERETDRIRFIHFACEAAGLVALTGRFLKPAPGVARWLDASRFERARQLFAAVFPSEGNRALDDLWRAYRLPGWRLGSPSLAFAPLLDILRQMRRKECLKLATLLKLVPLSPRAEPPKDVLRGVLRYLTWFGVVEWRGASAIQLTDWGAALLGRADALPPPPDPKAQPFRMARRSSVKQRPRGRVSSSPSEQAPTGEEPRVGVELVAPSGADWPTLYELSEYAELIAVRPQRRYRLDRDRLRRAIRRGTTVKHIWQFLSAATGRALPSPVTALLQDWMQAVAGVTLRRVTLLEVAEPKILTEMASERRTRGDMLRTLSPRAVVVREDHLPSLTLAPARSAGVRRLERQGLAPRVEFPLPAGRSTRRKFDQPTLAYLYLSVRLGHQLSDLIPSAYRAPYSILLDLEAQLSPRDRDLAAQLADEAAAHIRELRGSMPLRERGDMPAPIADALITIERAIQAGTPLEIVYYSPYRDEVTTRVVEPHRIEWHGRIPYLTPALRAGASVAYCQLDGDERTFRVDRIRECRVSNGE